MARWAWLCGFLIVGASGWAQSVDLDQSKPSHRWEKISNDFVEVIYPEVFREDSLYVANLIDHYSQVVGKTYLINKPLKFPLIIRVDVANPNGFVTLGPRRSEWYASSMFTPFVGSADWFQTLAIHEYRHVIQFDHFNDYAVKGLSYIMGDFGRQFAMFVSLPAWYLEGDAVWAETKYTDAGRGRSPRFLSRLKALVLSDSLPTYDQFLNGSYRTALPNHYVYGYVLVSYATQKFGEDVWQKVTRDVSKFPNPFRFYSSFKKVTGQSFEDFYNEAMSDLKTNWAKDTPQNNKQQFYRDVISPTQIGNSIYYVRRDLDSITAIIKETEGQEELVAQIAFAKEISWIHFGKSKAVFSQFVPDTRYGMVGFSELMIVDLKSGSVKTLLSDVRLYNASFNQTETKIIATEFTSEGQWVVAEFDLDGKRLQTVALSDIKIAQSTYLNDDTAVALINSKTGYKSLVTIDLKSKVLSKVHLPGSRNLLNALYVDSAGNVLFEAQYKGSTDIFRLGQTGEFSRCTNSPIGAFTPTSDGQTVLYSDESTNGTSIKKLSLAGCAAFDSSELIDFKYLGEGPSDHYNKFAPTSFENQEALYTDNQKGYSPKKHSDIGSDLLIPHTWGLMLGRGGSLGLATDNLLRTAGLEAGFGSDAEEGSSYSYVGISYKKYLPIFVLNYEGRSRRVDFYTSNDELAWREQSATLTMLLPFVKRHQVSTTTASLVGDFSYIDATDYKFNEVSVDQHQAFKRSGVQLNLNWSSDRAVRSLYSPWGLSYSIRYDDADEVSSETLDSYRVLQSASLRMPSYFNHDGFNFTYDKQNQKSGNLVYRFLPRATAITYAFSRGYGYQDVEIYEKLTGNYFFPLAYPDFNIPNWYYLRRAYANLFYDRTDVNSQVELVSYGGELLFESTFFRILPLTFGVRAGHRQLDNKNFAEAFLASTYGF